MARVQGFPFLLYSTGAKPTTTSGGVRSMLAPWIGGAAGKGHHGVGWVRHDPSVKPWREVVLEWAAQRALRHRAQAVTRAKPREALEEAAQAAADALRAVEASPPVAAVDNELAAMAAAANAAAGATRLTAALKHAAAVEMHAAAVLAMLAGQDEDEEQMVVNLLLLS